MNFKKYIPILAAVGGAFLAHSAQAQTFYIEEDPIYLRFEQYTGASGNLSFWRLPTPGVSTTFTAMSGSWSQTAGLRPTRPNHKSIPKVLATSAPGFGGEAPMTRL